MDQSSASSWAFSTLRLALVAYMLFAVVAGIVSWLWPSVLGAASMLYVPFAGAVGFFVGFRLPRYGWAYAVLPIIIVTALAVSIGPAQLRPIWLEYCASAAFMAGIGGFVGSKVLSGPKGLLGPH